MRKTHYEVLSINPQLTNFLDPAVETVFEPIVEDGVLNMKKLYGTPEHGDIPISPFVVDDNGEIGFIDTVYDFLKGMDFDNESPFEEFSDYGLMLEPGSQYRAPSPKWGVLSYESLKDTAAIPYVLKTINRYYNADHYKQLDSKGREIYLMRLLRTSHEYVVIGFINYIYKVFPTMVLEYYEFSSPEDWLHSSGLPAPASERTEIVKAFNRNTGEYIYRYSLTSLIEDDAPKHQLPLSLVRLLNDIGNYQREDDTRHFGGIVRVLIRASYGFHWQLFLHPGTGVVPIPLKDAAVYQYYRNYTDSSKLQRYNLGDEILELCQNNPLSAIDLWFERAGVLGGINGLITQLKVHYEEINETTAALQSLLEVTDSKTLYELFTLDNLNNPLARPYWEALIDGLGDSIVTATGVMNFLGVDAPKVMSHIAASNLSKYDGDNNQIVLRRDGQVDGKMMKGPRYVPINLDFTRPLLGYRFEYFQILENTGDVSTPNPLTLTDLLNEKGDN